MNIKVGFLKYSGMIISMHFNILIFWGLFMLIEIQDGYCCV